MTGSHMHKCIFRFFSSFLWKLHSSCILKIVAHSAVPIQSQWQALEKQQIKAHHGKQERCEMKILKWGGEAIWMIQTQRNTNSLRVCCNVGRPWHAHLAHGLPSCRIYLEAWGFRHEKTLSAREGPVERSGEAGLVVAMERRKCRMNGGK